MNSSDGRNTTIVTCPESPWSPDSVFRVSETHDFPRRTSGTEFRTSDSLGWTTIHATYQRGTPHEAAYPPIAHACLSMYLTAADFEYRLGRGYVRRIMEPNSYSLLPGKTGFSSRLYCLADTLHLHLRDTLLKDTAAEFVSGGVDALNLAVEIGIDDPFMAHMQAIFCGALTGQFTLPVLVADHLAALISMHLVLGRARPSRNPLESRHGALANSRFRRVGDYIDANLSTEIRLETLANLAGYSVAQFIRQFKATMGLTPYQYVTRLRVHRAKERLIHGNDSLTMIALDCGFGSQEHMTRVFTGMVGVPPGAFRRSVRET